MKIILLLFFTAFLSGCLITAAKVATGFKNPRVLSLEEIREVKNATFKDNENVVDLIYVKNIDTMGIYDAIQNSFNGGFHIYDRKGIKKCIKGKSRCGGLEQHNIEQYGESAIIDCETAQDSIQDLLSKTVDYDLKNKSDVIGKSNYLIVYYWSSFASSEKFTSEDFSNYYSFLKSTELDYKILRVNCDLREEWGLKHGKKLKMKFEKTGDRRYELILGELPWKEHFRQISK